MPDDTIALERTRDTRERAEIELAVAALHPERFGLRRHRDGWRKTIPGLGDVVFAPLGWQHAQCASYDLVDGAREPLDALRFLVRLQARVWGMPPEELVPVNILAILPDTGGSVLVAYREELGFNADGWLGFAIAAGGRSGTLVSHMLGVREEQRGTRDLGWHLKLLQGYEALRAGHRSAVWTFDPMRGANARLNLEKLGATVRELTLDKYGVLRSDLYGNVPSDRFTAYWDLVSATTHGRLEDVRTERYLGPDPELVRDLPEITPGQRRATGQDRARGRSLPDTGRHRRSDERGRAPGERLALRDAHRALTLHDDQVGARGKSGGCRTRRDRRRLAARRLRRSGVRDRRAVSG